MSTALENFLAPTVEITLGSKVYSLLFDFNAVAEVEERTGRNLMSKEGWDKLNGTTISIILWACLQFSHPEMTLVLTRRLMSTKNLNNVIEKVKEAWTLSKPEPEADTEQNPK